MSTPTFVVSLDFELFWGVADRHTVAGYGRNVLGEWEAIPRMLALFRQYGMRATWATVGMIMCRDYAQWRALRPSTQPRYARVGLSPYQLDGLAREHPNLFFARSLVERVLATPGQELASHTYSHFYCGEPGATVEGFAADLACAATIAAELDVRFRSIVFPRNHIVEPFLAALPAAGIVAYRGTPRHWLYRNGDAVAGGIAGRALRFADACLPLSGDCAMRVQRHGRLVNVPASLFLYPCCGVNRSFAPLRLARLKGAMSAAARSGAMFHLWWHPHNFGCDLAQNLALLEELLRHYRLLSDRYGMQSLCMGDFAAAPARAACGPGHASSPRPGAGRGKVEWSQP